MDTKALRQKILDLAIRGKLVPQDPNDEPASVLLDRIHAEKQQMVKDGKLKPKDIKNDTVIFKGDDNLHYEKFSDGTVKCIEDEIPFELPKGWEWTRLGCITDVIQYGLSNSAESTGDYRLLRITDIQNGCVNWDTVPFTSADEPEKYLLHKDDIVFARTGATVGKSFLITDLPYASVYASYLIRIRLINGISANYIYHFFNSYCYWEQVTDKAVGVGQPNCNGTALRELFIPLPSQAEQNRIVPVADNLLKIVDTITSEQESLSELIQTTKSKILDLAIRGKLVTQDPNDEPASALLERIRAEKEELIKQGKIKRNKKESVIFKGSDNSYYQDLPENWEICSIMAIAEVDLGKTLDKNKNTGKFYPYLRSVNIKWNEIDLSDIKEMQFERNELQRYSIIKGDLLICEGGDVGRCCIWSSDETIYYQNALHRVRFHGGCEPKYFLYFMMYLEHTGYLKRISNGVTIKHLTKTVLTTIPFMLPPFAEQKRIVDKIEKIFATLDNIANQVA